MSDVSAVRLLVWDEPDVRSRQREVLVAEAPADTSIDLEAVYLWFAERCGPQERPEACLFTTVAPGGEAAAAAAITATRERGFAVHVRRPPSSADPTPLRDAMASMIQTFERGGPLRELIIASHDANGLAARLDALALQSVPVVVLGFRELATKIVGRAGVQFIDLEDIAGVYRERLPRTNLFDLPDDGRTLPALRRPRRHTEANATEDAPAATPTPPPAATPSTPPALAALLAKSSGEAADADREQIIDLTDRTADAGAIDAVASDAGGDEVEGHRRSGLGAGTLSTTRLTPTTPTTSTATPTPGTAPLAATPPATIVATVPAPQAMAAPPAPPAAPAAGSAPPVAPTGSAPPVAPTGSAPSADPTADGVHQSVLASAPPAPPMPLPPRPPVPPWQSSPVSATPISPARRPAPPSEAPDSAINPPER